MRTLLASALLIVVASPAFAACVSVPPGDDRVANLGNERALTLCRAQELHDATALKALQLDIAAQLQAQQQMFEQQLRMQQTFSAAGNPAGLPGF